MADDPTLPPLAAVLFDLDDTLFLQSHWLDGAWDAVAARAADHGVALGAFRDALARIAAEGSARGGIIDRALAAVGADAALVSPLVDVFRSHRSATLPLVAGAADALARLRVRVRVGLVTDGDVGIQTGKVAALGLTDAFDAVIYSDELGREYRKPSPRPFLAALDQLAVEPRAALYIGDRPDKDVVGARAAGMRAIRVRTGEYAAVADADGTLVTCADVVDAIAWVERTHGW